MAGARRPAHNNGSVGQKRAVAKVLDRGAPGSLPPVHWLHWPVRRDVAAGGAGDVVVVQAEALVAAAHEVALLPLGIHATHDRQQSHLLRHQLTPWTTRAGRSDE